MDEGKSPGTHRVQHLLGMDMGPEPETKGFARCPSCGLLDDRRISCTCGYTMKVTVPPGVEPASNAPQDGQPARPAAPWTLRQLAGNCLIVVTFVALCAIALYFYVPYATEHSHSSPFERDRDQRMMEGLRNEMDRIHQFQVSQVETRNRERIARWKKQIEKLRNVKDEESAQEALMDYLRWNDFEMNVRHLDQSAGSANIHKRASNATEHAETAAAVNAEVQKVSGKYPRAFLAAVKKIRGMNP